MLTKSDLQQIANINSDLEKKFENKVIEFKDEILHEIKGLREEVALEKKVFPQV